MLAVHGSEVHLLRLASLEKLYLSMTIELLRTESRDPSHTTFKI